MIQFNLLPDVKLQYIKARRSKHMVMFISTALAAAAFAVLVILFLSVNVLQKQHMKHLSNDIKDETAKLKAVPDLDKMLTVQNQLKTLPDLHKTKPVSSRTFEYFGRLTPVGAKIANLGVDFTLKTITVEGQADSLRTVNVFIDNLKGSHYKVGDSGEEKPAFPEVVLKNFGKKDNEAAYAIDVKFDPLIFDDSQPVTLMTPMTVSVAPVNNKQLALAALNSKGRNVWQ